MNIIVCGSRRWHDRAKIEAKLYDLAIRFGSDLTIVHGGASGADRIAGQEAQKAGLIVSVYPADWEDHDRAGESGVRCHCQPGQQRCPAAGPRRNERMARNAGASLCVAFWDGRSLGTADMILRARRHDIPVEVVHP